MIKRKDRKIKIIIIVILSYLSIIFPGPVQLFGQSDSQSLIPYGNNMSAGNYVILNDVRLYYEIYGKGYPLILLHGNGGNIAGMKHQIEYFSKNYKVITMDCRGRGKSVYIPW
jgi:uncharacterized alpha/beta hydrolase family protein